MPKWKTKLPFWNTGRVYATSASKWQAENYGLVCTGNGAWKTGDDFSRLVCDDNGFDNVDFAGHRTEYIEYLDSQRDALGDSIDYLISVYNQTDDLYPPFIIGGAKCDNNEDLNKCSIIDVRKVGGNCIEGLSSLFVHCSGYRFKDEMDIGLITTPDELDTIHCDGCSLDPIVQNLICGDGEQVVESEKNNRICDDCFIRTAQCTAECQAYEYESYNYYDPDESPAYYDYSDRPTIPSRSKSRKKNKSRQTCGYPDAKHDFKQYCPDEFAQHVKNQLCDAAHHEEPLQIAGFGFSSIHIGALMLIFCFAFFIGFVIIKWNHLRRAEKYKETPQIVQQPNQQSVKRSETTKSEYDRTKHTEQTKLIS